MTLTPLRLMEGCFSGLRQQLALQSQYAAFPLQLQAGSVVVEGCGFSQMYLLAFQALPWKLSQKSAAFVLMYVCVLKMVADSCGLLHKY